MQRSTSNLRRRKRFLRGVAAGVAFSLFWASAVADAGEAPAFAERIAPLLQKFCLRCHDADTMKSGVRVDALDGSPSDQQLFLWKGILKQVRDGVMPPEGEPQLSPRQRHALIQWIEETLAAARARDSEVNGSVRRLTVSQYRNTLRDLLGLEEDLTATLPPDALSRDGFANNGPTMLLSPLLVESYFDIAEKALQLSAVDIQSPPVIQNFRLDLGAGINPDPFPDPLILGANSLLLDNRDFVVRELAPQKPFEYQPFKMRTAFEFIEGYQGNDTVRGLRKYDSIYHAVFACMRGTDGYPRGDAWQTVPEGLLLRPAIPSSELFGQSSTYGPRANFKVSLRELPDFGNFRVTVRAARYDDALLLDGAATLEATREDGAGTAATADFSDANSATIVLDEPGVYRADIHVASGAKAERLTLQFDERRFSGQLANTVPATEGSSERRVPFMLVRMKAGATKVTADYGDNTRLRRLTLTPVLQDSDHARRFAAFERRAPVLSVYLGLRRDCGSTLARVGAPRPVADGALAEFAFEGAINNFPSPDVEKNNVNYLAGIREIGVRSDYTDGRDMPRLLIRSVEFEGPLYETWPPAEHRRLFGEGDPVAPSEAPPEAAHAAASRAASVQIRTFASRAFRRPLTDEEEAALLAVWRESYDQRGDYRESLKDAFLVVLTSPQFLFLIESSDSPAPEDLNPYELAAKLSYFLWNTAPDATLLKLAAANTLHASLDTQIERLIHDPRFRQFADEFGSQWLRLDKFDVVEIDRQQFPMLTRDTKTELRKEPARFLQHLIEHNLPARNLIQSDFIMANEVVASYYGVGETCESGFEFVPIRHGKESLGGVLTQAAILSGLSDGREPNPVKRGAWLARKILAEPPDDPPPNVPQLEMSGDSKLSLRQRLERHRNQNGCRQCHAGIDPWGIPLQPFDAAGRFVDGGAEEGADSRTTLPDKTEIADFNELRVYLAGERIDRVAFSFIKHLASYAIGRSLSYREIAALEEQAIQLKPGDYRMQEMLRLVIKSDVFLKK